MNWFEQQTEKPTPAIIVEPESLESFDVEEVETTHRIYIEGHEDEIQNVEITESEEDGVFTVVKTVTSVWKEREVKEVKNLYTLKVKSFKSFAIGTIFFDENGNHYCLMRYSRPVAVLYGESETKPEVPTELYFGASSFAESANVCGIRVFPGGHFVQVGENSSGEWREKLIREAGIESFEFYWFEENYSPRVVDGQCEFFDQTHRPVNPKDSWIEKLNAK